MEEGASGRKSEYSSPQIREVVWECERRTVIAALVALMVTLRTYSHVMPDDERAVAVMEGIFAGVPHRFPTDPQN